MNPDEKFIAAAVAAGYSVEEAKAFLAAQPHSLTDEVIGGAAEVGQGATLGLGGMAFPGMKSAAEGFSSRHKVLGPALNIAGTIPTALAMPEAWGASMAGRALVGAGAGGIQAATDGEGSIADRAKRGAVGAGVGAVAGAILPEAMGGVGRFTKKLMRPFKAPASIVAEATGPLLPDNAVAMMARQEALAPGTAVPAGMDPGLPAATRVIGANPGVAMDAAAASAARSAKIQAAMDAMGPEYEALLANKRAPLDLGKVNIRKVIVDNGMWPGDDTAELTTIQALRNTIKGRMQTLKVAVRQGKGGGPKLHAMGEQYNDLTTWLKTVVPEIEGLDKDYGVLARARRTEDGVVKHIAQSRKAYASSRAAGIEPGSPGAALPSKGGFLHSLLSPNRARLAEEANRLLLQPGQIPEELLQAKMRAARGPGPMGLLTPFMGGSVAGRGTGLLDFQQ